jgi:methylated-DNA-[protein]-cysteine S-methyltransferase
MIAADRIDETPLGRIWAAANETGLVAVSLWDDAPRFVKEVNRLAGIIPVLIPNSQPLLTETFAQLSAYLRGELREFDLPIDWTIMKPFQRQALQLVCDVPYGHTSTYHVIATQMGQPGAARAVGQANAANPIPLIIPCHRILGNDGKLHGYGAGGGVETKAWLLRLEGSRLV